MKKEFVRNPYNYDSDELSTDTGLACKDESRTEQQHVEEADINYIADRFMRTGQITQPVNMPMAGDFQGIFDFQSAMNTIVKAKQEFAALPPKIRSRFQNDPAELIAFLENDANREEAEFLGLVDKKKPDTIAAPNQGDHHETGTRGRTQSHPQGSEGSTRTEATTGKNAPTQKSRRENPEDD